MLSQNPSIRSGVQAELGTRCGEVAPSPSVDDGTVLIPSGHLHNDQLDALVIELSQDAQVGITATMVEATPEKIPNAADQAHALLDMVQRSQAVAARTHRQLSGTLFTHTVTG
ncbi:hypothetical protein OHB12_02175 [Nocardia sp. NBC_01730]|uniref:hypothetical protein n=1 Tax=Nocardia sp. NBC_01730 TaxID=2975998 RepID=UPI002E13903F|nr:hypothetical protein OHB12_02175 [Nocardia sp. NBC_01730]